MRSYERSPVNPLEDGRASLRTRKDLGHAKQRIEGTITFDGVSYSKGSDAHKASVVGDTVGDPLRDTSGPSLNILIKLIAVVALVISPLIA